MHVLLAPATCHFWKIFVIHSGTLVPTCVCVYYIYIYIYVCVCCVCVCVCTRVRARVRLCARLHMFVCARLCVSARMLVYVLRSLILPCASHTGELGLVDLHRRHSTHTVGYLSLGPIETNSLCL